ncbi:MAG: hypothetical protein ACKOC5_04745 [Chloroflexota bacterium]
MTWSGNSAAEASDPLPPRTIAGINALPGPEKRAIYTRLIPGELLQLLHIPTDLRTPQGRDLLFLNCVNGSPVAEMALYHQPGFPDPVLYGQITDTINGYLRILLYTLNDPSSRRFTIDCLADGTPTALGASQRNLAEERAALEYGLAPGQVRRGLRLLGAAIQAFEGFVSSLGHDMYFAEPLYYHNAVLFERHGFNYQQGRRLMERIQAGFSAAPALARPGLPPAPTHPQWTPGDLLEKMDGSSPFRRPQAATSIRLRSWAIHDNVLGQPFDDVTMYKIIDRPANVDTCPDCSW